MNPFVAQDRVHAAAIAAAEAEEALWISADEEFGYGWEALAADPEYARFVSADDMPVVSDDDRNSLTVTIDMEEFHL